MSGGLNILGQLSQEDNEGDINLLSAGLGALTGAMTAPGTPGQAIGVDSPAANNALVRAKGTGGFRNLMASGVEKFGAESAGGQIFTGLDKASKFMTDPGLLKYTTPIAQGTGDLMFAQAKRDQDEYDRMMEEEAAEEGASNAQRAFAIRRAMEAQGATEEEIEDAIYAAGYQTGGRVGFRFGGIDEAIEMVEEETVEKGKEGIMQAAGEDPLLVEEYNKYVFDLMEQRPDAKPMSFQDFKRMIKAGMKDGGIMNAKRGLVDEPGGYAGDWITKKKKYITKKDDDDDDDGPFYFGIKKWFYDTESDEADWQHIYLYSDGKFSDQWSLDEFNLPKYVMKLFEPHRDKILNHKNFRE
jgi:uncharacterized short protein YbdD (DUF466 family)